MSTGLSARLGGLTHLFAELRAIAPRLAGTLGASGVSAVLGLVSGTVAARALGPTDRGDLAQLLLWPQLFTTVGILGIELSAIYFSGDEPRRRNVPATLLAVAIAQSLVLVPVYVIVIPIVFAGSDMMKEALMMAPLIPLYLIGAVSIDCLAGRLRFGAFNLVRLLLPFVYCGGIVLLAVSGVLSSTTGALIFFAAHAIGDLLALFLVWRDGGFGSFDRTLARDAVRFGLRAHFGRITPPSLGVDIAVIALMLSSEDVGLYVAAAAFLAAPNLLASSIGMVVFPQVSASHQSGERQRLHAAFFLQMTGVAAMGLALAVFAPLLIRVLFGAEYSAAAPVLRILALGSIAVSGRAFALDVLRGVGRPGLTSVAEASNWAFFLVAIPMGAALGGLLGVATAVTAAAWASCAVLALLLWRTGVLRGMGRPAGALGEAWEGAA